MRRARVPGGPPDYFVVKYVNETLHMGPPRSLAVGDEACVHLEIVPLQPRDVTVTLVAHVRAAQPGHWNATAFTQRDDASPFPNLVEIDVS